MPIFVSAVWCGRRTSSPDRGTTRCICYHHTVSEKLCHKLGVRCFPATRTSTGKLKQRLLVASLHCFLVHRVFFGCKAQCIFPVFRFLSLCCQRLHDRPFSFAGHTFAHTPQPVQSSTHLKRKFKPSNPLPIAFLDANPSGSVFNFFFIE